MKLSPHEIAHVAATQWTGDDLRFAVAVAIAESGGDTDVIARSLTGANVGQRDHGLWQISGRWHGAKMRALPNWRDPYVNAELARQVWDERARIDKATHGWAAWAVWNSKAYEQYLPDAVFAVAHPFPPPEPDRPADQAPGLDEIEQVVHALLERVRITIS